MYVRAYRSKGYTYYRVVESVWDASRSQPRQRVVAYLGKFATVAAAFDDAWSRYFGMRKGRARSPFTRADQLAWKRLLELWPLSYSPEFRAGNYDIRRADRVRLERRRWDRFMSSKAKAERLAAAARAILDIEPAATPAEIRSARDRKARECHPDHGGSNAAMAEINEAYERLTG